jgi:hypothetical protein
MESDCACEIDVSTWPMHRNYKPFKDNLSFWIFQTLRRLYFKQKALGELLFARSETESGLVLPFQLFSVKKQCTRKGLEQKAKLEDYCPQPRLHKRRKR